jgi:hypothetical protein
VPLNYENSYNNSIKMDKFYIGIDPGKKGCICVINQKEEIVEYHDIPLLGKKYNLKKLKDIFEELRLKYRNSIIALEQVAAVPRSGASSSFIFGFGAGLLTGLMISSRLKYEFVLPKTWQSGLATKEEGVWTSYDKVYKNKKPNEKTKKIDTKLTSLMAAQRILPEFDFFQGKKNHNDGLTDAFLISIFIKRKYH